MTKTMEQLLKKQSSPKMPQVGEIINGKVIEIGTGAVYIDLGPLGVAVVRGPELYDGLNNLNKLKINDNVSATVLELENEDGYFELSFKQASQQQVWHDLKSKMELDEIIEVSVVDANKGGLIIELEAVVGFLPVSQLAMEHYPRVTEANRSQILAHLKSYVGQNFQVKIINLDQEREKLIVSEKAAQSDSFHEILSKLKIGQIVKGEISGLSDFGAFIKFKVPKLKKTTEGLIHISEMAWQRIESPDEIVQVGDEVKAQIISLDNNRIALSLKNLQKDPWENIEEKYKVGQQIKGKVIKIDHFGAFVQIIKGIYGLAHISQFPQGMNLQVKKQYKFEIISLEPKEHRLGLKLAGGNARHKLSK